MNSVDKNRRQHGAALVVGLILLLVSTLVAVAAFQGSQMQERMSSNQYNKTLSFMAAEQGAAVFLNGLTSNGGLENSGWQNTHGDFGQYRWVIEDPEVNPVNVIVFGQSIQSETVLAESWLNLEVRALEPGPGRGAAINLVGPVDTFHVPNSNAFKVLGADDGPAIAVYDEKGATDIRDALKDEDRYHNYEGGVVFEKGTEQADGVEVDTMFRSQQEMQTFINAACDAARDDSPERCGPELPAGTVTSQGGPNSPREFQLTVVTESTSIDFQGGEKGAGILVVAGDLATTGTPNWDGIILVLGGELRITGGGTGGVTGTIYVFDMDTDGAIEGWDFNDNESVSFINEPRQSQGGQSGGGGTAVYEHQCKYIDQSLDLLIATVGDEKVAYWKEQFGCGGQAGANTGPLSFVVQRYIEVLGLPNWAQ